MKTRTMIFALLATLLAMVCAQASWAASANIGYWVDSSGTIVRNGTGGCWQTIYWTPALAVPGCDGAATDSASPSTSAPAPATPGAAAVASKSAAAAPKSGSMVAQAREAQPKKNLSDKWVHLEGANFATSSAKLPKVANVKLNEVVNAAKQYPEAKFEVSGHTDSRGKKAFNQKLSVKRAAAVKAWLVKHGVAANRVSTAGYADTQPVGDNETEAGRAANRRAEVRYAVMK